MNAISTEELARSAANYVPLTPLSLLRRSVLVHPERCAVRYGEQQLSYAQFDERCRRLAAAIATQGVRRGEVVSIIAPNTPAHLEAHFGVPMAGAVLHSINIRLSSEDIAWQLEHAQTKVLLVDREFAPQARKAVAHLSEPPLMVDIEDPSWPESAAGADVRYQTWLAAADPIFEPYLPANEWDSISLNYTSGTTGRPKGVVYHHRGAYLNAVGNVLAASIRQHPVYLWTLPMFHCNGWCFPWTVTALAGTHVCLRKPEPRAVLAALKDVQVTHFCAAPTVLTTLLNAPEAEKLGLPSGINALTAGAAPPAAIIAGCEAIGIRVTHVYGLTETYGPCAVSEWKSAYNGLSPDERARRKARQGVPYHLQEAIAVMDANSMTPVPADGQTIGEVMIRGNIVMKGYLHDASGTAAAFSGGWFHTGDLAVTHPDGYVEIRDRAKDIVISGGENISSIEVEGVLYRHPAVSEAAVVARPDPKWGETACAFITLRPNACATAAELTAFCRDHLAHFKVPKTFIFGDLPKTATGKVRKYELREQARRLGLPSG